MIMLIIIITINNIIIIIIIIIVTTIIIIITHMIIMNSKQYTGGTLSNHIKYRHIVIKRRIIKNKPLRSKFDGRSEAGGLHGLGLLRGFISSPEYSVKQY